MNKTERNTPLYLGFKDTWTCLAPWNALAVGLTDSDTCNQVNMGNTIFRYVWTGSRKDACAFGLRRKNPYAYGYNDACTAFARGGICHVSDRKLCDPTDQIGQSGYEYRLFTFPANDEESDNHIKFRIDLQFSVMKACKNKEAKIWKF